MTTQPLTYDPTGRAFGLCEICNTAAQLVDYRGFMVCRPCQQAAIGHPTVATQAREVWADERECKMQHVSAD